MIICDKYLVDTLIGHGAYGKIYKIKNIYTDELLAIKVEPKSYNLGLLKYESQIYNLMSIYNGFPTLKWYGGDDENYYMVLTLLNYSISDLINNNNNNNNNKLPLWVICYFGIQMFDRIKVLHNNGIIHRDLKPDNFLLGLNENYNILYIIDFGFSIKYIDEYNKHIPMEVNETITGTPNYISINGHDKKTLSRRDDVESICYMLLYMFIGKHLWKNDATLDEIYTVKYELINNTNTNIYNTLPNIFNKLFMIVGKLQFNETPNYNDLTDILKQQMDEVNSLYGQEQNIKELNDIIKLKL
jgi:serine/threonine protein kinase